jgi:hypothetical protein
MEQTDALRIAPSIGLILTLIAITMVACTSRKIDEGSTQSPAKLNSDLEQALKWLPTDTETLLVANRPFVMFDFHLGKETYTDHEVSSEELEGFFAGLTLRLFFLIDGLLEKHLHGKRASFALEASRHFRPPADLGELLFEGCDVAVFEDALDDRRDAFMKEAARIALRIDEIGGQKVAVFEEKFEQDTWKSFIVFPQKNVVLAASNEQFLREMLSRMRNPRGERALPTNLPEWKQVNTRAQFWGLRHFDKTQSKDDPTSPFGGKKTDNLPDDGAVGLTYECSPTKERKATLTYLSNAKTQIGKIEERRFPNSSPSQGEDTAALHIQRRELEPGIIQSTYDLSRSRPLFWFFFVFSGSVGHAIYV